MSKVKLYDIQCFEQYPFCRQQKSGFNHVLTFGVVKYVIFIGKKEGII